LTKLAAHTSEGFEFKRKEGRKMDQRSEIMDRASVMASVGGDLEFLGELTGIVQAAWPTLLEDIRRALADGDLAVVKTSARLMKVTTEYVSARRACLAATLLESAAARGDLESSRQAGSRLEEEINQLKLALAALGNVAGFLRC
jgi:hypothetical protein